MTTDYRSLTDLHFAILFTLGTHVESEGRVFKEIAASG